MEKSALRRVGTFARDKPDWEFKITPIRERLPDVVQLTIEGALPAQVALDLARLLREAHLRWLATLEPGKPRDEDAA